MALDVQADESERELATKAIVIQKQMNELAEQLSKLKQSLRDIAAGSTKEIIIEGIGKISISIPFAGSETEILVLNHDKLKLQSELKQKLLDDGVAMLDVKRVPACAAKVTIRPL